MQTAAQVSEWVRNEVEAFFREYADQPEQLRKFTAELKEITAEVQAIAAARVS